LCGSASHGSQLREDWSFIGVSHASLALKSLICTLNLTCTLKSWLVAYRWSSDIFIANNFSPMSTMKIQLLSLNSHRLHFTTFYLETISSKYRSDNLIFLVKKASVVFLTVYSVIQHKQNSYPATLFATSLRLNRS